MSNFLKYARFYDLLYADKDYAAEAAYIASLLRGLDTETVSVLDLGCGTGVHASLLASEGYRVHGVDRSEEMLGIAGDRVKGGNPLFTRGDARTVRLHSEFDAVISLFHVMSYQTTNADLLDFFATAREHLRPGGTFIFDCWYGPAVLSDRPVVRVKRCENADLELIRIAEPLLRLNENQVEINYRMLTRDRLAGSADEFEEQHLMRYLFRPEIELLASVSGFTLQKSFEFLTGKELGADTWNACFMVTRNE